jgi:hypothetical protein
MYCVDLADAKFAGAKLNWDSRELISEILRQAAAGDLEKIKVAGAIRLCRYLCWSDFIALKDPLTDWALDVLRSYVQPDDGFPAEYL